MKIKYFAITILCIMSLMLSRLESSAADTNGDKSRENELIKIEEQINKLQGDKWRDCYKAAEEIGLLGAKESELIPVLEETKEKWRIWHEILENEEKTKYKLYKELNIQLNELNMKIDEEYKDIYKEYKLSDELGKKLDELNTKRETMYRKIHNAHTKLYDGYIIRFEEKRAAYKIPPDLQTYQANLVYEKLLDALIKTGAYITDWKKSNVFPSISYGPGLSAISVQLGKDKNIALLDGVKFQITHCRIKKAYRRGGEQHRFAFWIVSFGLGISIPSNVSMPNDIEVPEITDNNDVILSVFFMPWGIRIDNITCGIGLEYKTKGKLGNGLDKFSIALIFGSN